MKSKPHTKDVSTSVSVESKFLITINGTVHAVTGDTARELLRQLEQIFGSKQYQPITIPTPFPDPWIPKRPWMYPAPTWVTTGAQPINGKNTD